jgi:hypothetical protein
MKLKLFVDDIRRCPDGWTVARTVSKAVRLLDTQDVEEVSLDHDIACYLFAGQSHTSEETFEAVARFIANMPEERRPKIVWIHTANPLAGDRMTEILKDKVKDIRRDWSFGEDQMGLKDWKKFEEGLDR